MVAIDVQTDIIIVTFNCHRDTMYIYALVSSDRTDDIRYIGKSVKPSQRLSKHISDARNKPTPSHKSSWIKSVISRGEHILSIPIAYANSDQQANILERFYIRLLRPTGRLTNLTEGGEGVTGWVPSLETRQNISRAKQGIPLSDSHRLQMSRAKLGKKRGPHSKEHKQKLSESCKRAKNKGEMPVYNQIWTKILDSSIWLEDQPTRIVWITFLAMMDRHGVVRLSSIGNVANRARVSLEEAEAAIECLSEPDAYNPDPEHAGRRIERIPGEGWRVINKDKYQKMMTEARIQAQSVETSRTYRKKKKGSVTKSDATVTLRDQNVTLSESDAESNTESDADTESIFRRWIDDAIRTFSEDDSRLVEIGVIETLLNWRILPTLVEIKSVHYFRPQIDKWCSAGLGEKAIEAKLYSVREKAGLLAA